MKTNKTLNSFLIMVVMLGSGVLGYSSKDLGACDETLLMWTDECKIYTYLLLDLVYFIFILF